MTKQRGQADAGPAGDIAHRRIGTMLGDDVTRDRENLAAIFFCVGSHGLLDKWIGDPYKWIGDPIINGSAIH